MNEQSYTNALIAESSPYLLQHAHNPVDWHAWNEKTLEKAKEEDKLMIISIGYAACHWCHVMEEESFEDTAVARIMNNNYLPIKVDREERPDIDQIYMDACNLVSGRGGWPLNAIALPDGRPVFAGTYFPRSEWIRVLNYFHDIYVKDRGKLLQQADRITQGLHEMELLPPVTDKDFFSEDILYKIFDNWEDKLDLKKGGRRGAPKFPMPNNYEYLLGYYKYSGNEKALQIVEVTLDEMARGGIYDHLGGGFARYSVDENWKIPHFEKMLYDNAQIVSLYSNAYQLMNKVRYKEVVEETLEFVKRELTSDKGGFYSSLDADSEGEEGKYYVWTSDEIRRLLGDDAEIFSVYYSIEENGNWEGNNILFQKKKAAEVARKYNITEEDLHKKIDISKSTLLKERQKRVKPGLDNKVITSWNALMISAYVKAYRVFRDPEYLNAAVNNAEFIMQNCMTPDFRLKRNYREGKNSINGFLDDYSFTIEAFIDLYQATFDEKWLQLAANIAGYTFQHFFDEKNSLFYYTSDIDAELIIRKKEISDNVIPSSNSSMAESLYALGMYLYKEDWVEISKQMLQHTLPSIEKYASFYSNWAMLLLHIIDESYEIAIVGKDWNEKMKEFDRHYLPGVLFLGGNDEGTLRLLQGKLQQNKTTIYVCKDKSCKMPVYEVREAWKLMD